MEECQPPLYPSLQPAEVSCPLLHLSLEEDEGEGSITGDCVCSSSTLTPTSCD